MSEVTPQPLLTTGLNGLVGSKLALDFADQYLFTNLDLSHPQTPVDITNYDQVAAVFESSPAASVVHFAGYTDVTGAWKQRDDKNGPAYQVNVVGTENVAKAAKNTNKHLIHISTAFVFDGEKPEMYTEDDTLNPIEWYGYTKAKAEEIVQSICQDWSILRIDFPFRSDPFPKADIIRKMYERLQAGGGLFTDHFFGPTFIDDFVKVVDWAVRTRAQGVFNASSGEQWSDFALGELLIEKHQLPYTAQAASLTEYLKTQDRPYQRNTALNTSKLRQHLDFTQLTISEAVSQVELTPTHA